MKKLFYYIALGFFLVFTLVTLYLSSSIIFDWFELREAQGDYVLFVVWVNFIAALIYLVALFGFFRYKKWTRKVLGVAALMIFAAFIGLLFHIDSGGAYELETIRALVLRFIITTGFAILAYFKIKKWKNIEN
ncbi:MAG: hypothetical protein RI572_06875 [Salegentibacter sp.]|uniref:hypothetical protein n=1 Tax=Salegentibacter sp. TaxID=1903072 RepID=UPI0028705B88|nr:hypothetical protein [Salegentibacter sp.]MDR9457116.1 hypothetical protein [Salegentibacter sp.]